MIQPIVKDPIFLAQTSQPATAEDLSVGRDLADTLMAHTERCAGMAANMIGVLKRIIVFEENGAPVVLYNPRVVKKSDPYRAAEGCLCLEGLREAKRWRSIKVQYQNEDFQVRYKTYTGWTAQIIQHEIDHCDGVLI